RLLGKIMLADHRFCFGCDGAVGFGVLDGGIVEQGYASLLKPRTSVRGGYGACLADCWSESFGCGGLTLASELGQSQLPDVLQKPASKGNSSTIATPRKQCQTQILHVTRVFQTCCYLEWRNMSSAAKNSHTLEAFASGAFRARHFSS